MGRPGQPPGKNAAPGAATLRLQFPWPGRRGGDSALPNRVFCHRRGPALASRAAHASPFQDFPLQLSPRGSDLRPSPGAEFLRRGPLPLPHRLLYREHPHAPGRADAPARALRIHSRGYVVVHHHLNHRGLWRRFPDLPPRKGHRWRNGAHGRLHRGASHWDYGERFRQPGTGASNHF